MKLIRRLSSTNPLPSRSIAGGQGNLYVCDASFPSNFTARVRKVELASGSVTTIANRFDGKEFSLAYGLTRDADGTLYVADGFAHLVWKLN